MKNKSKNERGFTLVELTLYIAITGMLMTSMVYFTWDIVYGRVKSTIQQEVNQNMRLASKRILYETRNAVSVNSVTASTLCLEMSDSSRNPTYFHVTSGRLMIGWGGGSSNCTSLTSDEDITSNAVAVSDLTFTDLSSGESENIQFSITIESVSDRSEFSKSETYTGSAELR